MQWNHTITKSVDKKQETGSISTTSSKDINIESDTTTVNRGSITDDDDDDDYDAQNADITLIALGNVRVETMSWMQVIRNKYGFVDKLNPSSNNEIIKPGRTASASMIAAEIERNRI